MFYVQLFTASIVSPSDQSFFVNSLDQIRLDLDQTVRECQVALNSFKNNKSPSLDNPSRVAL
jgi:hypothetical protein